MGVMTVASVNASTYVQLDQAPFIAPPKDILPLRKNGALPAMSFAFR